VIPADTARVLVNRKTSELHLEATPNAEYSQFVFCQIERRVLNVSQACRNREFLAEMHPIESLQGLLVGDKQILVSGLTPTDFSVY